jgi:myosin light chain 6
MSLPAGAVEEAKQVFEVYDKKYEGKVDAFYIGDMLRALNLAPTQADCEKRGQTKKNGEKTVSIEEFLAIYQEFHAMPDKTWGTYEDFMEGLKLYDKDQNGQLSLGELSQVLSMMAEKLPMEQVDEVWKATGTADDEEGMVKYDALVKKIMAGPTN